MIVIDIMMHAPAKLPSSTITVSDKKPAYTGVVSYKTESYKVV